MEHSGDGGHNHSHAGHGMGIAMPMAFTISTKVTILFTWWSTTTVISYIFTLLLLFLLACFNRFLGGLKLRLDRRPNNLDYNLSDVPKLTLSLSRWTWNRNSKDRMSPLAPQLEVNHGDTDHYGAFPTAPLLVPTSHAYSNQPEEDPNGIGSVPIVLYFAPIENGAGDTTVRVPCSKDSAPLLCMACNSLLHLDYVLQ